VWQRSGPHGASPAGSYVLNTVHSCCLAASGAPNDQKLRLYRVVRSPTGLRLAHAVVSTPHCTIRSSMQDLHLAHLPLLSSRSTPPQYSATERILRRLAAALRRRPVHVVLAMRCIAAYALSKLDFLHGACPPHQLPCLRIQRLVNNTIRNVLQLPPSSPVKWLHAAPEDGGLGVPRIWLRAQLHLLRNFHDSLNSRNTLIRRNLRHMWAHRMDLQHVPHDAPHLCDALQQVRGRWSLPPHSSLAPVVPLVVTLRQWTGQPVILISDGSRLEDTLAWAASVADLQGPLAFASASAYCSGSHSTAAEWLGRAQAVQLATALAIPAGGRPTLFCPHGRCMQWAHALNPEKKTQG
jgi:hypothetical protein